MSAQSNASPPPDAHQHQDQAIASLSRTHAQIVQALARLHLATADQITRLLFSPTSRNYVSAQLRALVHRGVLFRFPLRTTSAGQATYVYTVGSRGRRILAEEEEEGSGALRARFRPSEVQSLNYFHVEHALAVSEVLIAAELLPEVDPRVVLVQALHDHDLKRTPAMVTVPASKAEPQRRRVVHTQVVPDASTEFTLFGPSGQSEASILWEIDRNSHYQERFRKKLRALIAYTAQPGVSPYYHAFGVESVTHAIITTGDEHRVQLLRRWCEATLSEFGYDRDPAYSETWLLGSMVERQPLDPTSFFTAPRFLQPFREAPVALLPLGGEPLPRR